MECTLEELGGKSYKLPHMLKNQMNDKHLMCSNEIWNPHVFQNLTIIDSKSKYHTELISIVQQVIQ